MTFLEKSSPLVLRACCRIYRGGSPVAQLREGIYGRGDGYEGCAQPQTYSSEFRISYTIPAGDHGLPAIGPAEAGHRVSSSQLLTLSFSPPSSGLRFRIES